MLPVFFLPEAKLLWTQCCCCCLVTQLCLTLCDPMDCSLPSSSVHGISQARTLGVGCHFLFQWAPRISSVQSLVMSDSLWSHGLQHTRPPCPSPTLGAYSNSCQRVSDAVQSSHPLPSPSPAAFNLSWHQGLCWLVSSSHQVSKVSEFHHQHQSFQWIFRADFL